MAKTINFKATNVKPFTAWLKKFSSIEKSLLIEVDGENRCFTAKSYNEEKSVVKFSKISFEESGLILQKERDFSPIKVGVYSIPRMIKSLEHFGGSEFDFIVQYDDILDTSNKQTLAGIALLIKSPALKIRIECASLNIFKYISDDVFMSVIANTDIITKFQLPFGSIEQVNSLSTLDSEYKFLEFVVKNSKIYVKGKSFELEMEACEDKKAILSIFKDQFDKVDLENYNVDFGDEKLVFRSEDSETVTVVSMVVKDEKYEEESMDF